MFRYSNLSPGGRQTQHYDEGLMVNEVPVRIQIAHDTSYANQSYAKAEVWSAQDMSWHVASSVLFSEWAGSTNREHKEGPTYGILEVREELLARVVALLP